MHVVQEDVPTGWHIPLEVVHDDMTKGRDLLTSIGSFFLQCLDQARLSPGPFKVFSMVHLHPTRCSLHPTIYNNFLSLSGLKTSL